MIYTLTLNPAVDRELTVPAVEYDSVLRATESRVDFGGKGFNVSRLLKSLGATSTAVGFVGGRSGELLQHAGRAAAVLGHGTPHPHVGMPSQTAQDGGRSASPPRRCSLRPLRGMMSVIELRRPHRHPAFSAPDIAAALGVRGLAQ